MNAKVESLREFYDLMFESKDLRKLIVQRIFDCRNVDRSMVEPLELVLHLLEGIPQFEGTSVLPFREKSFVSLNLSYEIAELKKDIYYLTHSEKEFYGYLETLHPGLQEQLELCEDMLSGVNFRNFIADRDGTLNNYCGRYKSSIQSVYNSLFLTRFGKSCTENAVILTSAPLQGNGLLDVSIDPEGIFIYAGSKGREYIDRSGKKGSLPLLRDEQKKLGVLNLRLSELVREPKYEIFSLIGSGLQFKFGQTTIAKQDIYGSIPEEKSKDLVHEVYRILKEIDPEGRYFRTEDTGKDIEILLTVQKANDTNALKDFDKGDGIRFLDNKLNLHLDEGPNLICGDTLSDIPMICTAIERTEDTWALFISSDEKVKSAVKKTCLKHCFLSEPDMLVCLLNNIWERTTS